MRRPGAPDVGDAYLALPVRRCLDLRGTAAFCAGHLQRAVSVPGLEALKSRFSTLPPRDVPFLVVCEAKDAPAIRRVFVPSERWDIIGVMGLDSDADDATPPDPRSPRSPPDDPDASASADPWPVVQIPYETWRAWAVDAGIWADSTTRDVPQLLFQPAAVVQRAVEHWLSTMATAAPLTLLDLGCGAGRDLTYALMHARQLGVVWRGTGVDRWRAALKRAALLAQDLGLTTAGAAQPACEAWVPSYITDHGAVRPMDADPTATTAPPDLPVRTWAEQWLPHRQFDAVWVVRFWPRGLLPHLPELVAPGGLVVLSHFVQAPWPENIASGAVTTDYASPPSDARVQPHEMTRLCEQWTRDYGPWQVLEHTIEPIEDERPVESLILRRA